MFIELCTTCSSLHVCNRGCLSCFGDLRFLDELRLFALINGYYECLEHAHHFISVNMAVFSCQVVCFVRYGYNYLKDSSAVLLCCEGYALQCFHLHTLFRSMDGQIILKILQIL